MLSTQSELTHKIGMTVDNPDDLKKPWFYRTKRAWLFATNARHRREVIKLSRRQLKHWYRYDPKPFLISAVLGTIGAFILHQITTTRGFRLLCRWPTQDFNQLIADPFIVNERNKSEERAQHLSKLMKDSNYHASLAARTTDDSPPR